MKGYLLSWVVGVGEQAGGGKKKLPTWQDVNFYLDQIKDGKGSLTLDVIDAPDVGPQLLQVISDAGKYVLSLGEDDGSDYIVRSYFNPDLKDSEYEILGDVWSGKLVCLDFSIVKNLFEEFFLTGNVSSRILS
ncbi:DUF6911 family protein [Pseudomonas protegens]|uniref:DUF6911 family protein n=1 Tax=Pseudomonas protegens TaxID=380021 RepID=UPI00227FCE2C|nr:hypothetical protein [Pseudomonas protegens]MCY7259316.1 hypothetical protein [Pseudomonas protegens]